MRSTATETAAWLDLVATLARAPADSFPLTALTDQLFDTYGCVVSWNFVNADGDFGFEMRDRIPGFPSQDEADVWIRGQRRIAIAVAPFAGVARLTIEPF